MRMVLSHPVRRSPRRGTSKNPRSPHRKAKIPAAPPSKNTSGKSNVKVVVRVRPENQTENASCHNNVVSVLDDHVLVFDPKEQSPGFFQGRKLSGNLAQRRTKDLHFGFDHVFGAEACNQVVYEQSTKCILDGLLDGFNCSVFAYGATGAGKTHTMLGNSENPGVIFRTMIDLYERIEDLKDEKTINVAISYLEVYNETIRDLLVASGPLAIREDPHKGVVVSGLSLHQPKSAEELLHMLEYGNKNRTQHPTDANAESSRSHAVFQVFVKQKDRTASLSADVKVAKMSLIDLAGSERATATKNQGARFREGANINKSLLALGNCINALADGRSKSQHIPYRNSKLTRLLKDSLGGNCQTVMIAAVSPSSLTYDDTYNTLKYADRAKHIKATLKRNVMNVDFHVSQYVKIVEELRQEVSELKEKLRNYEENAVVHAAPDTRPAVLVTSNTEEIERLRDSLSKVFAQRKKIRKEILDSEASARDIQVRMYRRQESLSKFSLVTPESHALTEVKNNVATFMEQMRSRRARLTQLKTAALNKQEQNKEWLEQVEAEIMNTASRDFLSTCLRCHQLEQELSESKLHNRYLKRFILTREREWQNSNRLMNMVLTLLRKQHFILKGNDIMTSDLQESYNAIQSSLEGPHQIAWADQTTSSEQNGMLGNFDINNIIDMPVMSCVSLTPVVKSSLRQSNRFSLVATPPPVAASSPVVVIEEARGSEPRQGTPRLVNKPGFPLAASPLLEKSPLIAQGSAGHTPPVVHSSSRKSKLFLEDENIKVPKLSLLEDYEDSPIKKWQTENSMLTNVLEPVSTKSQNVSTNPTLGAPGRVATPLRQTPKHLSKPAIRVPVNPNYPRQVGRSPAHDASDPNSTFTLDSSASTVVPPSWMPVATPEPSQADLSCTASPPCIVSLSASPMRIKPDQPTDHPIVALTNVEPATATNVVKDDADSKPKDVDQQIEPPAEKEVVESASVGAVSIAVEENVQCGNATSIPVVTEAETVVTGSQSLTVEAEQYRTSISKIVPEFKVPLSRDRVAKSLRFGDSPLQKLDGGHTFATLVDSPVLSVQDEEFTTAEPKELPQTSDIRRVTFATVPSREKRRLLHRGQSYSHTNLQNLNRNQGSQNRLPKTNTPNTAQHGVLTTWNNNFSHTENKTSEALKRLGIPSLVESYSHGKSHPGYMSMTASSKFKRYKHRRSLSSGENHLPGTGSKGMCRAPLAKMQETSQQDKQKPRFHKPLSRSKSFSTVARKIR